MLFNSAIVVLSFANKVVKVQPRKFVRSLYGVPRTLHYFTKITRVLPQKSLPLFFSSYYGNTDELKCQEDVA